MCAHVSWTKLFDNAWQTYVAVAKKQNSWCNIVDKNKHQSFDGYGDSGDLDATCNAIGVPIPFSNIPLSSGGPGRLSNEMLRRALPNGL